MKAIDKYYRQRTSIKELLKYLKEETEWVRKALSGDLFKGKGKVTFVRKIKLPTGE